MKKFLSILAFCVAAVFTLVGAVAILKTGQTAIGIAMLVGAGLFAALGIFLRKKRRRRPSKPRGSRGASRKTPKVKTSSGKGRSSGRPEKKEPKKPVEPKVEPKKAEPEEKSAPKKTAEPLKPRKADPVSEPASPEPPAEEEKDVATQVRELAESAKEGYVYASDNGIAKIKEVAVSEAETHFAIELVVEISFFQGKLADEVAVKAETNHVIAAVNEKIKWLKTRAEKLGAETEIDAQYDFNE
ncbi:MAG: LPXTG cell wall anchor domain-containing protein [Clostridia bacterium]|nr:LPXTG cell wall anchor domain-containing protein [Clostridia bacterium]